MEVVRVGWGKVDIRSGGSWGGECRGGRDQALSAAKGGRAGVEDGCGEGGGWSSEPYKAVCGMVLVGRAEGIGRAEPGFAAPAGSIRC